MLDESNCGVRRRRGVFKVRNVKERQGNVPLLPGFKVAKVDSITIRHTHERFLIVLDIQG